MQRGSVQHWGVPTRCRMRVAAFEPSRQYKSLQFGVVFEWNGCKTKRRRVAPISGKSALLSFGVPEGQYVATIGAKQFAEKF